MRLKLGAIVVDSEDENPGRAVVINCPPATAAEWEIASPAGTVAGANPGYPADSQVIVVLFADDFAEFHPEFDGTDPIPLNDIANEAKFYSFPAPRLEQVGHVSELDLSAEQRQNCGAPEELIEIKERLEAGGMDVTVAGDHLMGVKLGETYTIFPDGSVDGDGALTDRIEAVAAEVIG